MDIQTIIISNREDVSVEYLISRIKERTEKYLRINSEDIGQIEFEINPGGKMACVVQDREFDLRTVKSVLFRRIPTKFNIAKEGENHQYLNYERKHFLEGLYLTFSSAKWINPMYATQIAERKLFQLEVAFSLGLTIPKSTVTNRLYQAQSFLSFHKASIIKPISNGLQVLKDRVYSIYTTEINLNSFNSLELAPVFDTPVFLQEKIDNSYDLRVTIIKDKVFSVKITKDSNEVDWRRPEITKRYTLVYLPLQLEQLLLKLHNSFGMIYSAIDMIVTSKGEHVFLEINPVGEWVWLEMELGIDISGHLIRELL